MDLGLDSYNTGTELTGWSRYTHHLSHTHTPHWSSTPYAQQERWLYTWTAEALSDVMPLVCRCIFYVAPVSIAARLSRYSHCQSFNEVSVAAHCHCWCSVYVASPHRWRVIGGL